VTAELVHRLHFAFTITFHYIFPQLTMGLALILVLLKWRALKGDAVANETARFFAKLFGLNFVMGVVTGIPMEFQFGTSWARFAEGSGAIVGQLLAMEGVFAFFLESAFLYFLLFGEKRLGQRGHFLAALMVFLGSWVSGFFITATNAWMQHPVGYTLAADGKLHLNSLWAVFSNPWLPWQYLHTMLGAVVTGSFFVAGIGAFYLLRRQHVAHGRTAVGTGVVVGLVAAVLLAFPAGDKQMKNVYRYQPATFAAMEGHFHSGEEAAGMVLIGQPNMEPLSLDNPIVLPRILTLMTHQRWSGEIKGLDSFPRSTWPTNVPLLYYSYHVMVGLGTLFLALYGLAGLQLLRGRLYRSRALLWALALALPFPFIANTAGWYAAELGRQPWLIYGVMRTSEGFSHRVSAGNALFTLLGFLGLYALLSILYLFLTFRILGRGPGQEEAH
jgi:cytochrome d ubiquinol oxidase subunit I